MGFTSQIVGFELAPTGIKVVGLLPSRKPKLLAVGYEAVTTESFTKSGGLTNQTAIGELMASALSAAEPKRLSGNQAYLSISEALVFRKLLELPLSVTESELDTVVKTEIAEFLPGSLESTEICCRVIGKFLAPPKLAKEVQNETKDQQNQAEAKSAEQGQEKNPEVGRQLVSVVAIEQEVIQDYLAAAAEAGVKIMAIDTKAAALARAILYQKRDRAGLAVIIDCEGSRVVVSLHYRGIIWATGVVAGSEDSESKYFWQAIFDEVDRARKFFRNRSSRVEELEDCYITGQFADPEEAKAQLQRLLDCRVQLARPATELGESFKEIKDDQMCALGSALYYWFE